MAKKAPERNKNQSPRRQALTTDLPGDKMTLQSEAIYFHHANERPYGAFSNFARYGVLLDDMYWPTVEHYFQGQKFAGTPHLYDVLHAPTPEEAKGIGQDRDRPLRSDWDQARVEVMRVAVIEKFLRYPELQQLLVETGDRPIIKRSRRDRFWGQGADGVGRNLLGQILMDARAHLSRAQGPIQRLRPRPFVLPTDSYQAAMLERDVLSTCALRFDGHLYVKTMDFDHMEAFRRLKNGEAIELDIHGCMALFFMLQRSLMKWCGVTLNDDHPSWRMFRAYFLALYDKTVPEEFQLCEYHREWSEVYAPFGPDYAEWIRGIHEAKQYRDANR